LRAQRAHTKAAAADASEAIPHAQYELGGGGEEKLAVGAHAYMLGCKSGWGMLLSYGYGCLCYTKDILKVTVDPAVTSRTDLQPSDQ
jgi:hypothetical protein